MPRACVAVLLAASVAGALGGCGGAEPPPPSEPSSVELPPASSDATSAPQDTKPPESSPGPAASAAPSAPPDDPSALRPSPEPRKPGASAPPGPVEFEGTLAARKGKVLIITTTGGVPPTGAKATLYRFFEQKVGPFNTSGWLGIADVTVRDADGGRVELTLDAEKSIIHVNGQKVDHFAAGNRVRLELAP